MDFKLSLLNFLFFSSRRQAEEDDEGDEDEEDTDENEVDDGEENPGLVDGDGESNF